jgi:hypothetical protein
MFACVSHSPLIVVRKREPEVADNAALRARVEAFAPDYILMFSNDHFASFHYSNMPVFVSVLPRQRWTTSVARRVS